MWTPRSTEVPQNGRKFLTACGLQLLGEGEPLVLEGAVADDHRLPQPAGVHVHPLRERPVGLLHQVLPVLSLCRAIQPAFKTIEKIIAFAICLPTKIDASRFSGLEQFFGGLR